MWKNYAANTKAKLLDLASERRISLQGTSTKDDIIARIIHQDILNKSIAADVLTVPQLRTICEVNGLSKDTCKNWKKSDFITHLSKAKSTTSTSRSSSSFDEHRPFAKIPAHMYDLIISKMPAEKQVKTAMVLGDRHTVRSALAREKVSLVRITRNNEPTVEYKKSTLKDAFDTTMTNQIHHLLFVELPFVGQSAKITLSNEMGTNLEISFSMNGPYKFNITINGKVIKLIIKGAILHLEDSKITGVYRYILQSAKDQRFNENDIPLMETDFKLMQWLCYINPPDAMFHPMVDALFLFQEISPRIEKFSKKMKSYLEKLDRVLHPQHSYVTPSGSGLEVKVEQMKNDTYRNLTLEQLFASCARERYFPSKYMNPKNKMTKMVDIYTIKAQ